MTPHERESLHARMNQLLRDPAAVISGLGVALVPRVLVEEELERGSLLCPFDRTLAVGQGHFLCYRPDRAASPLLAAFKAWILAQHRA